jgi:aryl-alcohol dehydrogenase-like predicted oxidoreductase
VPGNPIDQAIGVRRLGFGVSGLHGTKMLSPAYTHALIHRAYELGIRLFDTAPSYGAGEAEIRLGEALKRLPRFECIISTKVGVSSSGLMNRTRDFSPDGVRRSIDASLKRLEINRLDWLFLHGPAPSELTPELLKMLAEIKVSGQIGALGVAGRGPEIDAALETGLFSVFMAPVHAGLR